MPDSTHVDLNDVLDALCRSHGLRNRAEARRFLRESYDLHRRHSITSGSRLKLVREPDGKHAVSVQSINEQYQVISDTGDILPIEDRIPEPVIRSQPILPPEDPFDPVMLSIRSRTRAKTKIQTAPKPKTEKASKDSKQKQPAEKVPKNNVVPKRETGTAGNQPQFRQSAPKPGSKAEIIVECLKRHQWNSKLATDELQNHEMFSSYSVGKKANPRNTIMAAIITVKNRWYGRV